MLGATAETPTALAAAAGLGAADAQSHSRAGAPGRRRTLQAPSSGPGAQQLQSLLAGQLRRLLRFGPARGAARKERAWADGGRGSVEAAAAGSDGHLAAVAAAALSTLAARRGAGGAGPQGAGPSAAGSVAYAGGGGLPAVGLAPSVLRFLVVHAARHGLFATTEDVWELLGRPRTPPQPQQPDPQPASPASPHPHTTPYHSLGLPAPEPSFASAAQVSDVAYSTAATAGMAGSRSTPSGALDPWALPGGYTRAWGEPPQLRQTTAEPHPPSLALSIASPAGAAPDSPLPAHPCTPPSPRHPQYHLLYRSVPSPTAPGAKTGGRSPGAAGRGEVAPPWPLKRNFKVPWGGGAATDAPPPGPWGPASPDAHGLGAAALLPSPRSHSLTSAPGHVPPRPLATAPTDAGPMFEPLSPPRRASRPGGGAGAVLGPGQGGAGGGDGGAAELPGFKLPQLAR